MRAFCDSGISIVQQKGEPIAPVEQSVPLFVEIDLILSLRLSRLAAGAWRRRVVACGGCVAAASSVAAVPLPLPAVRSREEGLLFVVFSCACLISLLPLRVWLLALPML